MDTRGIFLAVIVVAQLASGCGDAGPDEPGSDRIASRTEAIISGSLDHENQAVVYVDPACSGTIIAADDRHGVVLTAAHCVVDKSLRAVVLGDDYDIGLRYPIADFAVHPRYDPSVGDWDWDMALLTIGPHLGALPVVAPLRPEEDTLAVGDPIEHSGFGLYDAQGSCEGDDEVRWTITGENGEEFLLCDGSQRRHGSGTIDWLSPIAVGWLQNYGNAGPVVAGVCNRDSGGAQLVVADGEKRVASVSVRGHQACSIDGTGDRVSEAYDTFIQPYVEEWIVPTPDRGDSVEDSSGCSLVARAAHARSSTWLIAAFMLGVVAARRRRPSRSNRSSARVARGRVHPPDVLKRPACRKATGSR